MVADNFYGEDRGLRGGLQKREVPYVMALKPSHSWWHPEDVAGSLKDVAREAGWESAKDPGKWVAITRTFRDGSTQQWWGLEIEAGPYGPNKTERAVVATTDPQTLPDVATWYLVTNLPAPNVCPDTPPLFAKASLEEVIRLSGLRMWVEQSYKQVKHALGWSQYQVRSDQAIRRHWQLICCAFSFCWYHASHPCSSMTTEEREESETEVLPLTNVPAPAVGTGEKNQRGHKWATGGVLAEGEAFGTRMVGALDHAERALGERGHNSPHRLFCKACLNSLGGDKSSSSMARSDGCDWLRCVPSPQPGSPGSWSPSSPACCVRFPRYGSGLPE